MVAVEQIPHAVPEAFTTLLEMGLNAPVRAWCAFPRAEFVVERCAGIEHVEHVLGISFPVRRQMKQSARRKPRSHQFDELRLHDATLVVTFLVPWIGEVQAQFGQRPWRDLIT